MSDQARQYELQIFDRNAREYRRSAYGPLADVRAAFEASHAPRRLVLASKAYPARPVYHRPRGRTGSGRTKQDIIGAYMQWAESKGLEQVHVYESAGFPATGYKGMRFIQVPVADFLGDAPQPETEE